MANDIHSDLELAAHHPYPGIEVQPPFTQANTHLASSQQLGHTQADAPESDDKPSHVTTANDPHRRILGLTVPTFWSLVTALALLVAGALGGGLGGGLAARRTTQLNMPVQQPTNGSTVTTELPIALPSVAPTDGGCPSPINGTTFTPTEDLNGAMAGIKLQGQEKAQAFVQLCWTNYPEASSDPGVHDLGSYFVRTFEECMTSCAIYNRRFQQNQLETTGLSNPGGEWYCTAVTLLKGREFYQLQSEQASGIV